MNDNSIWIVAVSGGPDSMALLDVLHKRNHKLIAAHVNYLTRDTSLRDENIVRNYCKARNINFIMKKFEVDKVDNFQNDAREFRYDFFKDLVEEYNADGVAMGHHFNDDLETYIFQKDRNMFSDAIGMSSKTVIKGINVWRPLLPYTKEYILEYCHENNIKYGIDESNLKLDYTRNRIRHKVSEMSNDEYENLLRDMKNDREIWEDLRQKIYYSVNSWETLVPLESYAKIMKLNRFLYLREWLRKNDIEVHEMSEEFLKEIDRNIIKKTANYQFENIKLISSYKDVSLFEVSNYEYTLNSVKYLETDHFSIKQKGIRIQGLTVNLEDFPLKIRNAREGDKIKMRYGTKRVSRFFIDEKIPHWKRVSWPVIENAKNEIIFVAGMGCDLYHYSNNPSLYMVEY